MKNKIIKCRLAMITGMLFLLCNTGLLAGCEKEDRIHNDLDQTESLKQTDSINASYGKLEKMEEVTIKKVTATIVLAEDGALPYRWEVITSSKNLSLIDEYTADKPDDFILAAGSSPAYHVYIFQFLDEQDAKIVLYNKRVNSDDLAEANENRTFQFTYDDEWKLQN